MTLRWICKSKIHRATVTQADLHYIGSIGIDSDLLARTNLIAGEMVCVWNIDNGDRIETYVIALPAGSGQVMVNGAAARHFQVGDRVIIASFCLTDNVIEPKMIMVDGQNRFMSDLDARAIEVPDGSEDRGVGHQLAATASRP